MAVLTPLFTLDENTGLGTPNFFNRAWDPEQSDYAFNEGRQSNMETFCSYELPHQQGQAEQDQLDYFSVWHKHLASQQQSFAGGYQSLMVQSNNDLDHFFEPSNCSLSTNTAAIQQWPIVDPLCQPIQMQCGVSCAAPSVFVANELENPLSDEQGSTATLNSPMRSKREVGNDATTRTSHRHGQTILAGPLPEKSLIPPAQNRGRTPASKQKQDESAAPAVPPKIKKARKARRKPLTKEQEEAKREKFLKMNRMAADKCRQNRKKWIDDLQAKARKLSLSNARAKSLIQALEEELAVLKSAAFIHSRGCNEKGMMAWVEREARRVHQVSKVQAKPPTDENMSIYSQSIARRSSPTGQPSSSCGLGVASDVGSRYSEVTINDDMASMASSMSGDTSGQVPDALVLPCNFQLQLPQKARRNDLAYEHQSRGRLRPSTKS